MLLVGTMNFGQRTPAAEAEKIIARALERGMTHFDTANVYNGGDAERILGKALRGKRGSAEIASKVGLARISGKPEGLRPERIEQALAESLERLGTDFLDLYYLHAPDPNVPIVETLGAIAELLASGRVRKWGVSNYASWQVLEMIHWCDAHQVARPAVSQVLYNALIREVEIEHLAFTRKYGIETAVFNALAGGLLGGQHKAGDAIPAGSRFDKNALYQRRYWTERSFALVESLRAVAAEEGMPLSDLAYAWLAGRPGVNAILIGPATVAQLDQAATAAARRLSPETNARMDALHRDFLGTDSHYAR